MPLVSARRGIHLNGAVRFVVSGIPQPPSFTTPPGLSGFSSIGQNITAIPGQWIGASTVVGSWVTLNVPFSGGDGALFSGTVTDIAGASGLSLAVTTSHVGKYIAYREIATNSIGSRTAISSSIGPIQNTVSLPSNTVLPTISGTTTVGQVLGSVAGTWINSTTVSRQWVALDSAYAGGPIENYVGTAEVLTGQTGTTLTLATSHATKHIVLREQASNSSGSVTVYSASRGPVVTTGSERTLTLADISYDMWGPVYRDDGKFNGSLQVGAPPFGKHEGRGRHLNFSWDWADGARTGQPPTNDFANVWGQLFPTTDNTIWNVRLQIRRVMLWFLDANNVWRKANAAATEDARPDGGWYRTQTTGGAWDFGGADAYLTPWRSEGAGLGWSTPLIHLQGQPASGRALLHWYYGSNYDPKIAVPAGTKAVLSHAQMRLIQDTGNVSLNSSKFIASFSCDNWPVASGPRPGGRQIAAFCQPRMKLLTNQWNWFTGYSLITWFSGGQPIAARMGDNTLLASYPPPVVGRTYS